MWYSSCVGRRCTLSYGGKVRPGGDKIPKACVENNNNPEEEIDVPPKSLKEYETRIKEKRPTRTNK